MRHDASGSQIDRAPSRTHSAEGALWRLSRELPRWKRTAYYTPSLEDAVHTAVEMARKRALEPHRAEPAAIKEKLCLMTTSQGQED